MCKHFKVLSLFIFVLCTHSSKASEEMDPKTLSPFLNPHFSYAVNLSDLSGLCVEELAREAKSFNLSENGLGKEHLSTLILHSPEVEVLNLSKCRLEDDDLTAFNGEDEATPLFKRSLKHLDISHNNLSAAVMPCLKELDLTSLSCSKNAFDNNLPKALSHMTNLVYLDARECNLDDTSIDDLLSLKNLKLLLLGGNLFTARGQEILKASKQIKILF